MNRFDPAPEAFRRRCLEGFLEDHPRAAGGLLLYSGRRVVRLGERVVAVPWWLVGGGEERRQ